MTTLKVLSSFFVGATPTTAAHYRRRFQLYARIASLVYIMLRTRAGWPNFCDGGDNMDEGPRKVWAKCLVILDDYPPKDADVHDGVLLVNGDGPERAVVPELGKDGLATKTATLIEAAAVVGAQPPVKKTARKWKQCRGAGEVTIPSESAYLGAVGLSAFGIAAAGTSNNDAAVNSAVAPRSGTGPGQDRPNEKRSTARRPLPRVTSRKRKRRQGERPPTPDSTLSSGSSGVGTDDGPGEYAAE